MNETNYISHIKRTKCQTLTHANTTIFCICDKKPDEMSILVCCLRTKQCYYGYSLSSMLPIRSVAVVSLHQCSSRVSVFAHFSRSVCLFGLHGSVFSAHVCVGYTYPNEWMPFLYIETLSSSSLIGYIENNTYIICMRCELCWWRKKNVLNVGCRQEYHLHFMCVQLLTAYEYSKHKRC